jgi:tol-pal system protein YbgF
MRKPFFTTGSPFFRALGVVSRRLTVGLLAGLSLSTAFAGLFDDEEARKAILDLRQRVDAVRQSADEANKETKREFNRLLLEEQKRAADRAAERAAEDNAQLRGALLTLQNQIELLKQELAKLRGQDEQLAKDVADVQRRQKDIAANVEDRFRKFEPVKVSLDGRDFSVEQAEKRDYDASLAAFRKGEFVAAQTAFVDFLRRYPASGYVAPALFWLGNAQYANRDHKEALVNFKAFVSQFADHVRAPEAMLSAANCQLELKDSKGAKKTLEDLVKAYQQSEAAVAARERLAKLK